MICLSCRWQHIYQKNEVKSLKRRADKAADEVNSVCCCPLQAAARTFCHSCCRRWEETYPLTWPRFSILKYDKRLRTLHKENTFRLSPEVKAQHTDAPVKSLSPQGSLAGPPPAGRTPAVGTGGGLLEAGSRSCVPRSSERLCRTQRTWALRLCPRRSTPWRSEWKNKFTWLHILAAEQPLIWELQRTIFSPFMETMSLSWWELTADSKHHVLWFLFTM